MEPGGEGIQGGITETENPLGVEQVPEAGADDNENFGNLSARELTERALAEEKAKIESPGGEGQSAQRPAERGAPQVPQGARPQEQPLEAPPARLTAAEKEIFNKFPPQMKAATARMFRDYERTFHQHNQKANQATQEAENFTKGVREYLMGRPHLIEGGHNAYTFVQALLGAHAALENPQTKFPKFARKDLGITSRLLVAAATTQ